jgi:hypothetical protein
MEKDRSDETEKERGKGRNLKNEMEWKIAFQSIGSFQVVFQNPLEERDAMSLHHPEKEGCPIKLILKL